MRSIGTGNVLFSAVMLWGLSFAFLIGTSCRESKDGWSETITALVVYDYLLAERTPVGSCKLNKRQCMNYYTHFTESEARALCANTGVLFSKDEDTCVTYVGTDETSPCEYFDGDFPNGRCPSGSAIYYCKYSGVKKKDLVYYSRAADVTWEDYQADCESNGGEWRSDY